MRSSGKRAPVFAIARANAVIRPILVIVSLAFAAPASSQSNAEDLFKQAQARESTVRKQLEARSAGVEANETLERARTLVGAFDDIARIFPRSPTSDDALWRGAVLSSDVFRQFGQSADRTTALRLFKALIVRYPGSSFVRQVAPQTARLNAAPASPERVPERATAPPSVPVKPQAPAVLLTGVRRQVLSDAVRVTMELAGETEFRDERTDGRLVIGLRNTRPVASLSDTNQTFPDSVVRQIRIGRPVGAETPVVLDLVGTTRHTTYALYNPFRVVIDFALERAPATTAKPAATPSKPVTSERQAPAPRVSATTASRASTSVGPNRSGGFSLSRQLGLGISRVVIDPGHGGHDPGAMNSGLSEAELVLDVASRLERMLLKEGVEVIMTRRTDAFVALEERTAIANRANADLFLSIHANASEDDRTRGVETYFLNFAATPAAEAVAARENAASERTMRQLPDIVKAITLSSKIDESRDFATIVQSSLIDRLKRANKNVRNLGVKQAPFMVLVGATMPSVLAEVSFLTNGQEATLLRGNTYRQQIAEALFNGTVRYQRSLKSSPQTVASQ